MYNWKEFNQEFNQRFADYINQLVSGFHFMINDEQIQGYVSHLTKLAADGKRVRPYVAYVLSQQSEFKITQDHWRYFVSLELLHLICLIHDDIIDESPVRRGTPTAHNYVASIVLPKSDLKTAKKIGDDQALLLGDLILSAALHKIGKLSDNLNLASRHNQLVDAYFELFSQVALGEMLDVDMAVRSPQSKEIINEKTRLKSALYTFTHPMKIGCLLANCPDFVNKAEVIGTHIGMGFQIQDDILDAVGDPNKTKKPVLQDISEKQQTLLTWHVHTKGTKEQQNTLRELFGKQLSQKQKDIVQALLHDSGAIAFAQKQVDSHFRQAADHIDSSEFSQHVKKTLHEVLATLKARQC